MLSFSGGEAAAGQTGNQFSVTFSTAMSPAKLTATGVRTTGSLPSELKAVVLPMKALGPPGWPTETARATTRAVVTTSPGSIETPAPVKVEL